MIEVLVLAAMGMVYSAWRHFTGTDTYEPEGHGAESVDDFMFF